MTTIPIQDGKLRIYSYVDGNPPKRTTKYAGGFKPEWEGECLYVIDWKLDGDKVKLTYQTRNDVYAPVYDDSFPLISETWDVPKPGRSKNWVYRDFGSCWFNTRTGERVTVY